MATLDLPHLIATGLIVFAVIRLIENLKALDGVSKGRKTRLKMVAIFVVSLLLNLVWPFGSTA